MGKEIEKKFLIKKAGQDYMTHALAKEYSSSAHLKEHVLTHGTRIHQGYMPLEKGRELADKLGVSIDFNPKEARLRRKGDKHLFTLKGDGTISRDEAEYEISPELFEEYWSHTTGKRVEKVRLKRPYQGHAIEIDVYTDRDLIVAEVETPTIDDANKLEPAGLDVTSDKQYKNKNLAK